MPVLFVYLIICFITACNYVQACTQSRYLGYCVSVRAREAWAHTCARALEWVTIAADSWAELKWKHEAQWQREQRDQALSSKTTPVLPTAASQLPPVKLLVCLSVCCVSADGPSFFESMHFSAPITVLDGEGDGQRMKKKKKKNRKVRTWPILHFSKSVFTSLILIYNLIYLNVW